MPSFQRSHPPRKQNSNLFQTRRRHIASGSRLHIKTSDEYAIRLKAVVEVFAAHVIGRCKKKRATPERLQSLRLDGEVFDHREGTEAATLMGKIVGQARPAETTFAGAGLREFPCLASTNTGAM